jgi:hypothetical protein
MTYLETACVKAMLRLPDAKLPALVKLSPKAKTLIKLNKGINHFLTQKALRRGGKIAI